MSDPLPSSSPFRTLQLDRSEGAAARLRLVAAVAAGLAALWIAVMRPPPLGWVCVAVGALASMGWLAMARRGRRRVADAARHRLVLDPDGLRLVEGDHEERVAWRDVTTVETDEERLVVCVRAHHRPEPLRIEPRYGGLGAYDLERALRRALEAAARGRSSPSKR